MVNKKITEMFKMQEILNNFTNGKEWKNGYTNKNNKINWTRAARFELIEAIDQSFQWKHWKNTNNKQFSILNKHNLKIEIVDCYHFIMSELIKENYFDFNNKDNFNLIHKDNLDFVTKEILNKKSNDYNEKIILMIENFEYKIFQYEKEQNKNFESLNYLFIEFWKLSRNILDFNEFYNIYILKNTLNLFRQKNGYQNGTYIKNWGKNEIEDNVFLDLYVKDKKNIDFEKIYYYLEENYKKENNL